MTMDWDAAWHELMTQEYDKKVKAAMDKDAQLRWDLAIMELELKATMIRMELGDEEINRRVKAMQESWQIEQAVMREYRRECKAAKARHEPAPPHPLHNPEGWAQYQYTQR